MAQCSSIPVGRLAEGIAWVSVACATVATVLWALFAKSPVEISITGANWIGIRFDALSAIILLLVCFMGAIILRYSRNYLAGDKNQGYFFKWMCITLGAVIAMVLAPGLVQFALAWVATSLGLHKLLIYFPDRLGTLLSSRKKSLLSRVGDLCLIAAFSGIYMIYGVQDFGHILEAVQIEGNLLSNNTWIGWLIIFGAILKSSVPFHTWLPDTMGTPTPCPKTLVAVLFGTAAGGSDSGFFVWKKNHAGSRRTLFWSITSMVMLSQTSVKRALAYSTIAQMGFMLLQCGLGAFRLRCFIWSLPRSARHHSFPVGLPSKQQKAQCSPHYTQLKPSRIWLAIGISFAIVLGLSIPSNHQSI